MKEAYDIIVTIDNKMLREATKQMLDKLLTAPFDTLDFTHGYISAIISMTKATNHISEIDAKILNDIIMKYVNERKENYRKMRRKQHKK